jgi:hypothetical protein
MWYLSQYIEKDRTAIPVEVISIMISTGRRCFQYQQGITERKRYGQRQLAYAELDQIFITVDG